MAAASLVAVASGVVVPRASADQISNLQAQAQALAAKITQLGQYEAAKGEQYDAAVLALQDAKKKVAAASAQVAAADATTVQARSALKQEAIQAYVQGGSTALSTAGGISGATSSLLAQEYEASLASNQSDAVDQFHLASLQDQSAKQKLQAEQASLSAQVNALAQDRQAATSAQAQLQATLDQDKGQIATLVAQQQAAQAAAEQAAAQRRLAAQQAAAAQARAAQQAAVIVSTGHSNPTSNGGGNPPPPPGKGAAGAVAAALTRVGDPYVWGASGPTTFDCSGLVMWSYAQVGISLPHYSGAQFADGTHISMADLQPGDLVFPANPGEHVAMYIGNGDIVEAPYTGADVHVVPMGSWFVYAVRIA